MVMPCGAFKGIILVCGLVPRVCGHFKGVVRMRRPFSPLWESARGLVPRALRVWWAGGSWEGGVPVWVCGRQSRHSRRRRRTSARLGLQRLSALDFRRPLPSPAVLLVVARGGSPPGALRRGEHRRQKGGLAALGDAVCVSCSTKFGHRVRVARAGIDSPRGHVKTVPSLRLVPVQCANWCSCARGASRSGQLETALCAAHCRACGAIFLVVGFSPAPFIFRVRATVFIHRLVMRLCVS